MTATRESPPIIGLYALYARDHGLSPGQFAIALMIWSVVPFALELPSGVLADRMDRRRLLQVGAVAYLGTFVVWALWPTFAGIIVGFALWGVSTALESGTFEALLYDEVAARGRPGAYGLVRSRSRATATVSLAVAIAASGPLFNLGGYPLLLWLSIASAAAFVGSIRLLPAAPVAPATDAAEGGDGGYLSTLRTGLAEVARSPLLRRILWATMLVVVVVGVDEYVPMLLASVGVSTAQVAGVLAVMVALEALAALASPRLATCDNRLVVATVPALGAAILGGTAWGAPWLVATGVCLGYALVSCQYAALDIRLQAAITGSARATVTSVGGVSVEVASVASFAAFGTAAQGHGWTWAVGVVASAAVLPVAVTSARAVSKAVRLTDR